MIEVHKTRHNFPARAGQPIAKFAESVGLQNHFPGTSGMNHCPSLSMLSVWRVVAHGCILDPWIGVGQREDGNRTGPWDVGMHPRESDHKIMTLRRGKGGRKNFFKYGAHSAL